MGEPEAGEGPPELTDGTTVELVDQQISSELEGERVILELESGTYYGVNRVGARIWELLEEPRTVAEIRETIVEEFDTTPEECDADAREFVSNLLAEGLAEVVDGE